MFFRDVHPFLLLLAARYCDAELRLADVPYADDVVLQMVRCLAVYFLPSLHKCFGIRRRGDGVLYPPVPGCPLSLFNGIKNVTSFLLSFAKPRLRRGGDV